MTYIFSGIFSEQEIIEPFPSDTVDLVFRPLKNNQLKSGVLFPKQAEEQIDRPDQNTFRIIEDLKNYGLTQGFWMYYMCWGGVLECVATANLFDSKINMQSYALNEDIVYEQLADVFSKHSISIDSNGHFDPFVRNFWGEHGY